MKERVIVEISQTPNGQILRIGGKVSKDISEFSGFLFDEIELIDLRPKQKAKR